MFDRNMLQLLLQSVTGFVAWLESWRGGHVRLGQNRHIVVNVAGRDCLLSPILAGCQAALTA